MQAIQVVPRPRKKLILQKQLQMLRELRQKQDELKKLEGKISNTVLQALRDGGEIEPGRWTARVITYTSGNRRINRLVID